MFELVSGLPPNVIGIRARGRVDGSDYASVLVPQVEAATAAGQRTRLLLVLGEGFEGYDPSAMLADTEVGIRHLRSFERIAVVTDTDWVRHAIHLFGPLIPGDVRVFAEADEAAARAWIAS
jgi:hypothetical protein